MAHTKRIRAPKFWRGGKRTSHWAPTPKPGKHAKKNSLPLLSAVRDVLKLAGKSREVRFMLSKRQVLVDTREVTRKTVGLGLMDTLAFIATKQNFRVVPSKIGLELVEIPANEANLKILRLIRKKSVSKGNFQLTFHDGRTLLMKPEEAKSYSIGDSILFDLKASKPKKQIKMEQSVTGLVFEGKHRGVIGKISEIKHNEKGADTVVLDISGKSVETLMKYVMPVGTTAPEVKLDA